MTGFQTLSIVSALLAIAAAVDNQPAAMALLGALALTIGAIGAYLETPTR